MRKASEAHFLGVDHRPRNDGTGKNSIESGDDSCVFRKHLRDDPVAFSRVHFYCRFFAKNERIS